MKAFLGAFTCSTRAFPSASFADNSPLAPLSLPLSPMMARPNLTLEEAKELAHFIIPAAPDVRLPSR